MDLKEENRRLRRKVTRESVSCVCVFVCIAHVQLCYQLSKLVVLNL